jgi:hypothetical protein
MTAPASPESQIVPAAPDRPPGVPWTVRVADWSARHRWPVFALWFVATIGLFIASIAAGGTNSAEAVSNNDRAKYEAAEAFVVYNAANADAQQQEKASAQFLLVVTNPNGTMDDPAFAPAVSDMTARLGELQATVDGKAGPVFEDLVDPRAHVAGWGWRFPSGWWMRSEGRLRSRARRDRAARFRSRWATARSTGPS